MSDIGRLDAVRNLKQFFELAGNLQLDLSESCLPVAVLADLSEGAYSLGIPFICHGIVAAVAGQFGWVGVRINPAAPFGTRINVRRIFPGGGMTDCNISVSSEEPSAAGAAVDETSGVQSGTQVRRILPVQTVSGTRVAAPSAFGLRPVPSSSVPIELDVTIVRSRDDQGNLNPCIFLHSQTANQQVSAGFFGYLHEGGGK